MLLNTGKNYLDGYINVLFVIYFFTKNFTTFTISINLELHLRHM